MKGGWVAVFAVALLVLSKVANADQYICQSITTAYISDLSHKQNYIESKDKRQWFVDSEKGFYEINILPEEDDIKLKSLLWGNCEYSNDRMDGFLRLECRQGPLSVFYINVSGMMFAYTDIVPGNSEYPPAINSAVGSCKKV